MNHSDVQRYMPDYLEGDLTLDRRALFDAHLDECADCAREAAGFRATIAALRRLPDPAVPADLTANVLRRIRLGEGRTSVLDRLRAFGSELLAPRVLAPVSAALLVAGVVLGTGDLRDGLTAIRDGLDDRIAESGPPSEGAWLVGNGRQPVSEAGGSQSVAAEAGLVAGQGMAPLVDPRTQGQELMALSQLLDGRSTIRTRFNDWPAERPAPTVAVALNPMGPVVERSARSLLPEVMVDTVQRWPSADEWLVHVQERPGEFADLMARRTLAEQEHWIDSLASRALERGELNDIVTALRASGNERARILADDFAAANPAGSTNPSATLRRD